MGGQAGGRSLSLSREEKGSGEAETGRVKGHARPSPPSTAHTLSRSRCQVGLQRLHLRCVCACECEREGSRAAWRCSDTSYGSMAIFRKIKAML